MTVAWRRFPDVQALLMDLFADLVGDEHVAITSPADLYGRLPFIRVRRFSGTSDRLNDYAAVDVDVFAPDYAAADTLAEQVHQMLLGPPPPVAVFDRIDVLSAPRELEWGDPAVVRRFSATYRITSRRVRAA